MYKEDCRGAAGDCRDCGGPRRNCRDTASGLQGGLQGDCGGTAEGLQENCRTTAGGWPTACFSLCREICSCGKAPCLAARNSDIKTYNMYHYQGGGCRGAAGVLSTTCFSLCWDICSCGELSQLPGTVTHNKSSICAAARADCLGCGDAPP